MDKAAQGFRRPGLTVIGITGAMASGKSAVAAELSAVLGGELVDADLVCRELMEPGQPGWLAMATEFGDQFFLGNQSLDRGRLRRSLFHDNVLRQRLDQLLHPLVKAAIAKRLAAINKSVTFVVVEVPLLFEAGWGTEFDVVVVVSAEPAQCLQRLMQRDQVSQGEAEAALAAQWPLAEKARLARYVIDNAGDWPATRQQLLTVAALLEGKGWGAP